MENSSKEIFRFEREDGLKIVIYENMNAILLSDDKEGDCFYTNPRSLLKRFLRDLNSSKPH